MSWAMLSNVLLCLSWIWVSFLYCWTTTTIIVLTWRKSIFYFWGSIATSLQIGIVILVQSLLSLSFLTSLSQSLSSLWHIYSDALRNVGIHVVVISQHLVKLKKSTLNTTMMKSIQSVRDMLIWWLPSLYLCHSVELFLFWCQSLQSVFSYFIMLIRYLFSDTIKLLKITLQLCIKPS